MGAVLPSLHACMSLPLVLSEAPPSPLLALTQIADHEDQRLCQFEPGLGVQVCAVLGELAAQLGHHLRRVQVGQTGQAAHRSQVHVRVVIVQLILNKTPAPLQ